MMLADDRFSISRTVLTDEGRLAAVHRTDLLDSPIEETFDALSRLASTLVGAPVTFLSIVDADRDFYKSQCGMPEALAEGRQLTGRTFCQMAIAAAEPLVINDTHSHPVWRSVPSVDALGVRAYVGVPLLLQGQAIGSFCVVDWAPREWTETEIEVLVQLGRSAEREISLRQSLKAAVIESDRARTLARKNEELVAVVAHDLRSPLQVIGLTSMLLTRTTDESIRPHVRRLESATEAMTRMVDGLLIQHATAAALENQRATISSATLLSDTAETMRLVVDNAGLRIMVCVDDAADLSVDYAQMLRVFCNLVGNCVKYCPAGSTVRLMSEMSATGMTLRVSDDGPGMSDADQAKAFDRGWQGGSDDARRHGAGLGLAIVRDLVEQNGGRVTLSATLGSGTTVSIWFQDSQSASSA